MKTLFCCGTATQTSQGQAGLWRWWYYYRPLKNELKATHYAVSNDGSVNIPHESFVNLIDASKPITRFLADQLNFVHWPTSLPRLNQHTCPGYYRSVYTMAKAAKEQGFDKMIYAEWDFWIITEDMMREIASIDHGLVGYWVPRHMFVESNLLVCCADQFEVLMEVAQNIGAKKDCKTEDIAEFSFPWTEVRKNRTGDRYPEFANDIPIGADYCAQLPLSQVIYKKSLTQIAQQKCPKCAGNITFDYNGVLACAKCEPARYIAPVFD